LAHELREACLGRELWSLAFGLPGFLSDDASNLANRHLEFLAQARLCLPLRIAHADLLDLQGIQLDVCSISHFRTLVNQRMAYSIARGTGPPATYLRIVLALTPRTSAAACCVRPKSFRCSLSPFPVIRGTLLCALASLALFISFRLQPTIVISLNLFPL